MSPATCWSRTRFHVFLADLDAITDELEREATVGIIHNCMSDCVTPPPLSHRVAHPLSRSNPPKDLLDAASSSQYARQLISSSRHYLRYCGGLPSINPDGEASEGCVYLIEAVSASRCNPLYTDLGSDQPVSELVLDIIGQQVVPCPDGMLCVPSRPHEAVLWDSSAASTGALQVVVDRKVGTHVYYSTINTLTPYYRYLKSSNLRSAPAPRSLMWRRLSLAQRTIWSDCGM